MTISNSGDYELHFSDEPAFGNPAKTVVTADLLAGGRVVERFQWTPAEFETLAKAVVNRAAPIYRHIPDMSFGDVDD